MFRQQLLRLRLLSRKAWLSTYENPKPKLDTASVRWDDERSVAEALGLAAEQKLQPVSLQDLFQFGKSSDLERTLLVSGKFLHNELPNRLAKCISMIDSLPYGLPQNANVRRVRKWYVDSFKQICQFPALKDNADELQFSKALEQVLDRHAEVLTTMAQGIQEVKKSHTLGQELHLFLDTFYTMRIGIRALISQQLSLRLQRDGYVGIICTNCNPATVIQAAADEASFMCERNLGDTPEIVIKGEKSIQIPYVADHLYYMLLELLKNSCRAVTELHKDAPSMPAVNVIVSGGEEDVTIKVSDEGGGIPRSSLPLIWSYFYTTARTDLNSLHDRQPDHTSPILAGYGFGLPICRLYARYWGGDATVIPMQGYGMDAYLHLCRLGDSKEPLA